MQQQWYVAAVVVIIVLIGACVFRLFVVQLLVLVVFLATLLLIIIIGRQLVGWYTLRRMSSRFSAKLFLILVQRKYQLRKLPVIICIWYCNICQIWENFAKSSKQKKHNAVLCVGYYCWGVGWKKEPPNSTSTYTMSLK